MTDNQKFALEALEKTQDLSTLSGLLDDYKDKYYTGITFNENTKIFNIIIGGNILGYHIQTYDPQTVTRTLPAAAVQYLTHRAKTDKFMRKILFYQLLEIEKILDIIYNLRSND